MLRQKLSYSLCFQLFSSINSFPANYACFFFSETLTLGSVPSDSVFSLGLLWGILPQPWLTQLSLRPKTPPSEMLSSTQQCSPKTKLLRRRGGMLAVRAWSDSHSADMVRKAGKQPKAPADLPRFQTRTWWGSNYRPPCAPHSPPRSRCSLFVGFFSPGWKPTHSKFRKIWKTSDKQITLKRHHSSWANFQDKNRVPKDSYSMQKAKEVTHRVSLKRG